MGVAKTQVLISFAVTAKLICAFLFALAKIRFSHGMALIKFGVGLTVSFIFGTCLTMVLV